MPIFIIASLKACLSLPLFWMASGFAPKETQPPSKKGPLTTSFHWPPFKEGSPGPPPIVWEELPSTPPLFLKTLEINPQTLGIGVQKMVQPAQLWGPGQIWGGDFGVLKKPS